METIYLNHREPFLQKISAVMGYSGHKIRVRIHETVNTQMNSYWDGGTRSTYTFIDLATMNTVAMPLQHPVFDPQIPGLDNVKLIPGIVCVEHSIFCGKDMGLIIHVCPEGLDQRLLPPKQDALTLDEKIVLHAACSLKPSYAGISDYRFHAASREANITRERYDAAKASLIAKKLLNRAGAVTPAGRNARETFRGYGWPKE